MHYVKLLFKGVTTFMQMSIFHLACCRCLISFTNIWWIKWSAKSNCWCPPVLIPTGLVAGNSQLLANKRFFQFYTHWNKMEIDFKGFTLHIATRQFVQTRLGPNFSTVLTPGHFFGNPLKNAQRGKWRSFFNKHHNPIFFGCWILVADASQGCYWPL